MADFMLSAILSKAKELGHAAIYLAYCRMFGERSFEFNGSRYRYFYHRYNNTCETERSVEIPIALNFLRTWSGLGILEIGNVLNHYAHFPHTVVDKYEVGQGVINVDVCDFRPTRKYDAIIAISTIEHVGWDEEPFDPEKAIRSIELLRQMLTPHGCMLASVPIGHNRALDQAMCNGTLGCTELRGMKRLNGNNWVEVSVQELTECRLRPAYRPRYNRYRRTKAVAFAYFWSTPHEE